MDIAAIKKRLAAIWTSYPEVTATGCLAVTEDESTGEHKIWYEDGDLCAEVYDNMGAGYWSKDYAALFAAAPSDIRDLLAEVESLRAAAHEVVTLADAAGPDTFWTRWNDLAEAVNKLREVVGL